MHTWERSVLSNSKGWLELGLLYHLRLNKEKGRWEQLRIREGDAETREEQSRNNSAALGQVLVPPQRTHITYL